MCYINPSVLEVLACVHIWVNNLMHIWVNLQCENSIKFKTQYHATLKMKKNYEIKIRGTGFEPRTPGVKTVASTNAPVGRLKMKIRFQFTRCAIIYIYQNRFLHVKVNVHVCRDFYADGH